MLRMLRLRRHRRGRVLQLIGVLLLPFTGPSYIEYMCDAWYDTRLHFFVDDVGSLCFPVHSSGGIFSCGRTAET